MAGKALRHKLEAMALKAALGLFGALPLERASAFGAFIAGTLGPRLGVTNRARANMARAMPELAPAEREAIIKKMWRNLGRTIGEYAHLHEFQLPAHRGKLGLSGTENLSVMEERDKGAIFISGHFGNWEIAPLIGRLYGLEGAEIYRHANNPYVDEWMVGLRARAITPLQIPKGSKGAREILKVLKEKKIALHARRSENERRFGDDVFRAQGHDHRRAGRACRALRRADLSDLLPPAGREHGLCHEGQPADPGR